MVCGLVTVVKHIPAYYNALLWEAPLMVMVTGWGRICVFRDFSAGIGKGFILAGVLGGGLSFCGV